VKRVAVLGAGLVGRLIAIDLASEPSIRVRAFDRSEDALAGLKKAAPSVTTAVADLASAADVARAVEGADAVAVAVPGFLGHALLARVLASGKPAADISFSPEDPFALDDAAKEAGVAAVVDCGVAPGLSNLLVGRSAQELDQVDSVSILVGGLPVRRVWPWEYRAVFSPSDVLEEYTRPCRIRRGGREVVVPALSEPELIHFEEAGTLEAFLTDGLRTLLRTQSAPDLVEKTLRYPGHAEKLRLLREAGFLSAAPIDVGGARVSPRELTERLLFPSWELPPGEDEFTVMRVELCGKRAGAARSIAWTLFDRTDPATRFTSMARTTGFPCAVITRMLLEGAWRRPGIHPLEHLGVDAAVTERILRDLAQRGVRVRREERAL